MRSKYLLIFLAFSSFSIYAQPVNDDCLSAIFLSDSDHWCSAPATYTNTNATPYAGPPPDDNCFLQLQNEVWFTFVADAPAMYVKISGMINGLGTLTNPGIGIFEGPCNSLKRLGCNISSSATNQVEVSIEGLSIGQVYYLLVEGLNNNSGTFQICLNSFIPPPNPQSDCNKAVILCDKSQFVVDTLLGVGAQDPGVSNTCIGQEFSSAWYKWTCDMSGTLTFVLTPNNYQPGFESDDIDFVLYELPNGIDDCNNKIVARCMAAGANTGQTFSNWVRCNGPTGLRLGDPDVTEPAGCQISSQNNFVKELDMVAGRSYALLVNNFSQSGLGFSIEWGGTGTFQGPLPAFDVSAVQAFECDKTIIFSNESTAPTDSIVKYLWNFGAGATPAFDTTTGPVSVVYESFGPKKVALTVESSKGCVVTEFLDFFVEACCQDTSTLAVTATIQDQICPETASGYIQGIGLSGSPAYQFSLDCINYQPSTLFPSLFPGQYTLCVQDQKGCENQIDLTVLPSNGFSVEAGDTLFVQLGETTNINAAVFPNLPTSVSWNLEENMEFSGTDIVSRLNPTVLPTTTEWYVITITNDAGCVTTDSVLIVVDAYKPIYIPNVITPNQDFINDNLTIYGNVAATTVQSFQIFDRWGGMMWEGRDFPLNDPSLGWDGTHNGKPVNSGVFAYVAIINFVDNIPVTYHGTVTVLR